MLIRIFADLFAFINRIIMIRTTTIFVATVFGASNLASAQSFTTSDGDVATLQLNTITTAVPFLLIAPDSRSGAMGDAGVALSPDANAMYWNPAKLAFAESEMEVSLSYTPWLRQLVPDINMAYLSGYKKIDDDQAFGVSMRYFSLGDITFTDGTGNVTGQFSPNEFAVSLGYARKLSERWSAALSGRFIYSNLTGNYTVGSATTRPGVSAAADISGFYQNDDIKLGDKDGTLAFGLNVSNIGAKMSYTDDADRDFIPMNMRLGAALTIDLDEYNKLTFTTDLNKLLVPTPPIYKLDSTGQPEYDVATGNLVIAAGRDPNVGVASGIFGSFTDAPGLPMLDENGNMILNDQDQAEVEGGSKFKEEMREINISTGFEYWYADQFALRGGYFHEHATKGNRKYFTLGAGMKYKFLTIDFAYLIATSQRNPLANTLRFTLRLNFADLKAEEGDTPG